MLNADVAAGLVCLAVSIVLLIAAQGLPRSPLVPIGPDYYPRLLFSAAALLSAGLIVAGLLARRRPPPAAVSYRLVVATFVIFAAYVAALPLLGFRMATLLFVLILQVVLDPPRGRRWLLVLSVAGLTTLVTYLVFERYLSVLLPRGRLTGF